MAECLLLRFRENVEIIDVPNKRYALAVQK